MPVFCGPRVWGARDAGERGAPLAVLDRFRLLEKTLLPLVLMATVFAVTIGAGVAVLHHTVASYREILSRNAPAVLRIQRLNALTDQVGYAVERNLDYRCTGVEAPLCARTEADLSAAAAEGEQRLAEAVRFDPDHRADYDRFHQAFRGIVEDARRAMVLGMKDDKSGARVVIVPVNGRILALSDALYRYSSQRTLDNRAEGLALAATARMTEWNMILVGALAALLGLGIAAWIGLAELTVPLLRLCTRMAELAEGHLDAAVEGQDRRDEIGRMARAVQVFKENAKARLEAEAEAERAREAAAQAKRDAQAEIARVARVLSVGELASSITHEINQPIGAIAASGQSALGWLQREPPDLVRAMAAVERTVRDSLRAGAIVQKVRGMLTKSEPQLVPLAVNAVIEDVLGFLEDERRRRDVTVRTDFAADLPPVMGDPIQLQQVVLNLVMNGIEAMRETPPRGRVMTIRTRATNAGFVSVAVEDRGSGIAADAVGRVFDPFFTTKASGVGLGLAITRSIVESHGGRIWAEPAAPNGALFQFTLPAVAAVDIELREAPAAGATA
jgi:C4-dicarboxylate-specific signal transduction histidine kinase